GDGRCSHSCRAVREGGREGQDVAGRKLAGEVVGSEDNEAAAVGNREVDGQGAGGVRDGSVEARGNGADPVAGGGAARRPGAGPGGPVAFEAQGGDGAPPTGAERGGEGGVQGAIGGEGRLALADAVAELAVVGQGQGGGGSRHGGRANGRGTVGEGGREGQDVAGQNLALDIHDAQPN